MPRTVPLQDETQVVTALTRLLREEKERLGQGGAPSMDSMPEWQALLEDLQLYAEKRRSRAVSMGVAPVPTDSALALQQEYQELQHVLMVWSGALKEAMDRLGEGKASLTYGAVKSRSRSLGAV